QLNTQIQVQKASIISTEKQLFDLQKNLEALNDSFNQNLIDQNIEHKEKVVEILGLNLNVEVVRNEIEEFTVAYKTLNNKIQNLDTKVQGTLVNQHAYLQLEQAVAAAARELTITTENVTKNNVEISRLTKALSQKKELLTTVDQLKKRGENLKTIMNL